VRLAGDEQRLRWRRYGRHLFAPADGDRQCLAHEGSIGVGAGLQGHPLPLHARQPDAPHRRLDAAPLAGPERLYEIWRIDGLAGAPLQAGDYGSVRYRHDGNLLFGSLSLEESTPSSHGSPLQTATERAYREIFGLLDALRYPALLRIWNYLPQINAETYGIERYRQFNIGRQDAFLACSRSVIGNVPAACALGANGGRLNIAFVAARAEPIGIENPRPAERPRRARCAPGGPSAWGAERAGRWSRR
jgi:hypothetical protein